MEFGRQDARLNFWELAIFFCVAIFFSVYSCVPFWIPAGPFSRTYVEDFKTFHPKLNSALQDYAKGHKGNSFQIARLGSDAVIIQGIYQGERDQGRYTTRITIKPAGAGKSRAEIEISARSPGASSTDLQEAARDLFRTIEKGTGARPLE